MYTGPGESKKKSFTEGSKRIKITEANIHFHSNMEASIDWKNQNPLSQVTVCRT